MMRVKISSIGMVYNTDDDITGVQVYFEANNLDRTLHINGSIPLTTEEYEGNESFDVLEQIVRQAVIDGLNEGLNE